MNLDFFNDSMISGPRSIVENPWSETTKISVLSSKFFSSSVLMMAARFLSLLSSAATAASEPTPAACWEASASLNQSSEYLGTPFFHRPRVSALVVQESGVLGVLWFRLNGL